MRTGSNHNVALIVALVIISVTLGSSRGTDAIGGPSRDLQISNQRDGSLSETLLHMRHQLKSLFTDWNLGESEGSIARTFGRIRMMRKIIIPMAFMGGFLTSIIIGIKMIGVINMLLIGKVLMLQVAIVLGKIIYGAKDLFFNKYPQVSYPVYSHQPYLPTSYHHPPSGHHESHHSSFANAFASSREDDFRQQPTFSSDLTGFAQPQFNSINHSYKLSQPQASLQPQFFSGQPQSGSFLGIVMQAPQQVRIPQQPQFSQPFNQNSAHSGEKTILESFDNNFYNENEIRGDAPVAQALVQQPPSIQPSMTPQEMQKMLSDAIAQMSAKATQKTIRKRSPKSLNYTSESGS